MRWHSGKTKAPHILELEVEQLLRNSDLVSARPKNALANARAVLRQRCNPAAVLAVRNLCGAMGQKLPRRKRDDLMSEALPPSLGNTLLKELRSLDGSTPAQNPELGDDEVLLGAHHTLNAANHRGAALSAILCELGWLG